MITLREGSKWLSHEHSHSGIAEGKCLPSLFKWPEADDIIFSSAEQKEERPHSFCMKTSLRPALVSSCTCIRFTMTTLDNMLSGSM